MRVYELAKKLNMETKDILIELQGLGINVHKGTNAIDKETAIEVINILSDSKEKTPAIDPKEKDVINISCSTTIGQLAKILNINTADLIKSLMDRKIFANINHSVDSKIINAIADIYHFEIKFLSPLQQEEITEQEIDNDENLLPRPPVVTIMGHVDHGKTKLLDAIRKSNIIDTEAGGITQHIGAYKVKVGKGEIVFLDTPGHEAFTAMRARGVKITDIVVLVVSANEGVMPQTIEAIDHIKAAEVPVIVAINKIDLPDANPTRVKQQLSEYGLLSEEWGGKTIFVEISAKQNIGLDHLLEMILLEAEMIELKANPNRKAEGVLIESRLDKGKGPVATVLVQKGTLKIGNIFIAGNIYGKVRAMFNDKGERIKLATPSTPVEVLGFNKIAQAGDQFKVVKDEKIAKQIVLNIAEGKSEQKQIERVTLEDLYQQIQSGKVKELNVIIKADVSGSIGAITDVLMRIGSDKVKIKIVHSDIGEVTESDIMLACASNCIIISFHISIRPEIKALAENNKVDIRTYNIIYELTKEMKKALEGLLDPKLTEVLLGTAVVRQVFKIPKMGVIAGSYVKQGKILRGEMARLIRKDEVIVEAKITSLKRFKDDVNEVVTNYECGIGLNNVTDIQSDDIINVFTIKKEIPQL